MSSTFEADVSDRWAIVDLSGTDGGGSLVVRLNYAIELPVAKFSMRYGLNAIPTASVMLGLGRSARTNRESVVKSIIPQLQQMTPIDVRLTGKLGDWSTRGTPTAGKEQWPEGDHLLFVGYVGGVGFRRVMGQVYLVVNLVHKLVDLSLSACATQDIVPGLPQSLLMSTLNYGAGIDGQYANAGGKFTQSLAAQMAVDFSEGLLTSLTTMAKENAIQTTALWCAEGAGSIRHPSSSNVRALRVLEADKDASGWKGMKDLAYDADDVGKYVSAYPLKDSASAFSHIAQYIGVCMARAQFGASMWSLLVSIILPDFGMGIVPSSDRAYLVPLLPMSREPLLEISPADYLDVDLKTLATRPLYGVGVAAKQAFTTLSGGQANSETCVRGSYIANVDGEVGEGPDGMWLVIAAPGWLDGWVTTDPSTGTRGVFAADVALSTPTQASDGTPPSASPALSRDPTQEAEYWSNLMSNYARMFYATNALKGRDGSLTGKLRFDVTPGTTIRIKGSSTTSGAGSDSIYGDLFAFVAAVNISIDAETPAANTTFELTNIRTEAENAKDRFSMTTHPFFDSYFNGAPLVHSLQVK